jgi:hypothetical protein
LEILADVEQRPVALERPKVSSVLQIDASVHDLIAAGDFRSVRQLVSRWDQAAKEVVLPQLSERHRYGCESVGARVYAAHARRV